MPSYLHPGVYLEEIASGSRPIESVATSITAFVGFAHRGEEGKPKLIGKFDDYINEFGPIVDENDAMGLAVRAFYLNGGSSAYICRLLGENEKSINLHDINGEGLSSPVFTINAISPGVWGDKIQYKIEKDSSDSPSFSLLIGEFIDGKFNELERFDDLSMNEDSSNYILLKVNDNSNLIKVISTVDTTDYQNSKIEGKNVPLVGAGGVADYINDPNNNHTIMISVNGLPIKNISLTGIDVTTLTLLATDIENAIKTALDNSQIVFERDIGKFIIRTTDTTPKSTNNITLIDSDMLRILGLSSTLRTSTEQGVDKVIPKVVGKVAPKAGEVLGNGKADQPTDAVFSTFYSETLRKYRDISIIVVPGSSWGNNSGKSNIEATLAHCEFMKNRVLILDPPAGVEIKDANKVESLGLPTSTYSVLYYPWVSMSNPLYHPDKNPLASKIVNVAPSAIAAGMWAKIDGKRGVWKAPAGVKTQIIGAQGLEYNVDDIEQNQLNPLGVNSIRNIPNFGSVFWGARTLATRSDPEWRYVPVRRTAIFIEESIYNGIQWAVFEPNTHLLWSSLRANIGSFMNGLFRSGAFQGQTANDAYFVRCGLGDTMTQGDIDRGQVIVTVGFAPIKPAEFVIVRIQQMVGEV